MAEGEWEKVPVRKPDRNHENAAHEGEDDGSEEEPDFSDPEGFVDDITDEGNKSKWSG